MANTIKIKNSGTISATPSALEYGELGLNYADGKLFYKNGSGTIVPFSSGGTKLTTSDTPPVGPVLGELWYETDSSKTFIYYDSSWVEISGATGPPGPGGAQGYYGMFQDNLDQIAVNNTTAYPLKLRVTDEASGVSIQPNGNGDLTRITFENAGVYNIMFSLQTKNPLSVETEFDVWFRKNGVDVPNSNSHFTALRSHLGIDGALVMTMTYLLTINPADYIEIVWHVEDVAAYIANIPAGTTPSTPAAPSAIVSVAQVMYGQIGPVGPPGPNALSLLTDVSLSNSTSGQALLYNGTTWVNSTVATDPMNDSKFSAIILMDIGV